MLVSVIIPTYNRANVIEKAVRSVWAQTYRDWELIISDDGSTDNTAGVVDRLSKENPRIRYIRHESNRGAQVARNKGIKAAKGEWIAFLDSDDEWLSDSLQLRMDLALTKGCPFVYSNGYIIFEDGRRELNRVPDVTKDPYRGVLAKEGPMFPTLLVKKDALEKIGHLDESVIAYQEWDTSIRLAKICPFGFLETPTFIYDYRTPGAISRDYSRNGKAYADIVKKFFWEMLLNIGPKEMVYHYDRIADWYRQADEKVQQRHYKKMAFLFKCLSPRMVGRKIKNIIVPEGKH